MSTYMCTHTHIYICMCVCNRTHICMYVCMYLCTCVSLYVYVPLCDDPKPHRVRSVSTINSETERTESPLKMDYTQALSLTNRYLK